MKYKNSEEINELVNFALSALQNKKHIFITGEKSSGKSYLRDKLLARLAESEIETYSGIITKAIRDDKFFPKSIILYNMYDEAQNAVIAIRNKTEDGLIPNSDAFDITGKEILTACRQSDVKYIVIDELGVLENNSEKFKAEVLRCLAKKQMILVLRKASTEFLDSIKGMDNGAVIDLSA